MATGSLCSGYRVAHGGLAVSAGWLYVRCPLLLAGLDLGAVREIASLR